MNYTRMSGCALRTSQKMLLGASTFHILISLPRDLPVRIASSWVPLAGNRGSEGGPALLPSHCMGSAGDEDRRRKAFPDRNPHIPSTSEDPVPLAVDGQTPVTGR